MNVFSRLLLRIKIRIMRPFERLLERNTGLLLERNREQADVLSALATQLAQLANTVSLVQHGLADLSAEHGKRLDALLQAYGTGVRELASQLDGHGKRLDALLQAYGTGVRELASQLDGTAQTLTADLQQWAGSIHERLQPLGQFSQRLQTIADDVQNLQEKPNIEVLQVHDHKLCSYDSLPPFHPVGGWHIGTGIDHPAKLIRERVEMWQQLSEPALLTWHAGLKLIVWPGNDMSRAIFITGQYEPSEMCWLADALDTGMTFVDVGANVGFYSLVASKLVGETGRVLTLEPSKREYQRLSCHVVLNNLRNVDCYALAASDARGTANLRVATDDKGGHNTFGGFADPSTELLREESVPTCPLDELVEELKLERVDVVKIDVEGAELKVLQGMRRIVERWRPKILFELAPDSLAAQNTSVEALLDWFPNKGYKLLEFAETTGFPSNCTT